MNIKFCSSFLCLLHIDKEVYRKCVKHCVLYVLSVEMQYQLMLYLQSQSFKGTLNIQSNT